MQRVLPFEMTCSSLQHCVTFHNMLIFLQWQVLTLELTHKLKEHPFSSCPHLSILHICSHLLYVWVVHLLPRSCVAVVTMTHLTWTVEVRTGWFMCDCGRICHSMAFYGLWMRCDVIIWNWNVLSMYYIRGLHLQWLGSSSAAGARAGTQRSRPKDLP